MSHLKRNGAVKYTLKVPNGRVIPLYLVADAMARGVATNYGELKFHRPTYDNVIGGYKSDLLDAARSGRLAVCNERGAIGTADGIIEEAKKSNSGATLDADGNIDWNQTHLNYLNTTAQSLNDWMRHKGDTFTVVDMPVEMIEYDLTDSNGKVIEPGYYRGYSAAISSQSTLTKEASEGEPEQSEMQGKVPNKRDHELHDLINQVFIKLGRPRNNSDVWEALADSDNDKNEVIQEIYNDRIDWISRRGIEQTMKRKTFDNYLSELRKT